MKRMLLVCVTALALAACGDGKSDQEKALEEVFGPGGPAGGFPGAMGESSDPTKVWEQFGNIELTDAMMESYVNLLKKTRGHAGRPDKAMLEAYSLNGMQWLAISGIVGRASLTRSRDLFTKQLEAARERLAKAPEDQKAQHRAAVEGYENMLKNVPESTELDRKNYAVLERWRDRIDEATRSK